MLKANDSVALVCCSNPYQPSSSEKIRSLVNILSSLNLNTVVSPYLYTKNSTPKLRGEIFNEYMADSSIKVIFDVSGGDLCNEILEYIDFDSLKNNTTLYCGYSDNSVLINSLYKKSKLSSMNYQITRLLGDDSYNQLKLFKETFLNGGSNLTSFNYRWINSNSMKGIVLGGNIRCTLKLAGTEYLPDFKNSILFLESLGGDENKIRTFITHYKQLGVFSKISGIILGEFTELEKSKGTNAPIEILKSIVDTSKIPIIKTEELGHSHFSKGIFLGKHMEFN